MAGCMVFIFAALGEFVVVRVLNSQTEKYDQHLRRVTVISHGSRANNTTASNTNNYNNGLTTHYNHNHDHYTRHHQNTNSRNRKPVDVRENGHIGLSVGAGIGNSEGTGGTRAGLGSSWDPEAGWVGRVPPPTGRPRQQIGRLSLQWIDPKTGEKKILAAVQGLSGRWEQYTTARTNMNATAATVKVIILSNLVPATRAHDVLPFTSYTLTNSY
ncbi:hypothetical protein O3P69_012118 [Scylla paramamosain]|uniref:Uncharacterized protein n=1 Tax=Scylla paramamosain TaxID=85552 RepID=A0AAW0TCJ4_SCYPA